MNHPAMLVASTVIWGGIEIIDAAFLDFNIPWWMSLVVALIIVYGGVFVYVESDPLL